MLTRFLVASATIIWCVAATSADDTKLKVKEGDKFPSVEVAAVQLDKVKKDTKSFKIEEFKGKTVVVFFYPKAMTGG